MRVLSTIIVIINHNGDTAKIIKSVTSISSNGDRYCSLEAIPFYKGLGFTSYVED